MRLKSGVWSMVVSVAAAGLFAACTADVQPAPGSGGPGDESPTSPGGEERGVNPGPNANPIGETAFGQPLPDVVRVERQFFGDGGVTEGPDAGTPGPDAGPDTGFAYPLGSAGPWPTAPVTVWNGANGLDETSIIAVSTDEAQNLWAVSHSALYLLRPGETKFRKYTREDGLNLDNAEPPGITAMTGGLANEVWVGYHGADVTDTQKDPNRFKGKLDRVLLKADGTLEVIHYDVHNNDGVGFNPDGSIIRGPDGCADPQYTDISFNEDRSVRIMLYDHVYNHGNLYVGYNHGVGRIWAGHKDSITCADFADHVHPVVYDAAKIQRMGDWWGLALDPTVRTSKLGKQVKGTVWMGGKWSAGATTFTDTLYEWPRNDTNPFYKAFSNPPVFPVADGEVIHIHGVAALSDGSVYFGSGPGDDSTFTPKGIAKWTNERTPLSYIKPEDIGLPGRQIITMNALPDDTILFGMYYGGLWRWDPKGTAPATKVSGLPSQQIFSVYVDQMVSPPAAYVGTGNGAALVRLEPVQR